MKAKLLMCAIAMVLCSAFFAMPVFATEASTRAAAIANTLERYQVSPEWQPDIKNNFELLDELYDLVNNFSQEDVDKLGNKYDSIKKYYAAYCVAKGLDPALPNTYSQTTSAYEAPLPGSCREQANTILATLVNVGVDYNVEGDIKANSTKIESMLLLAYEYTDDELDAASSQEKQEMLNYFTGLYKYRGWDITELDLLFTTKQLPNVGIVLAPVVPQKSPTVILPKQDAAPPISQPESIASPNGNESNEFVSGLVALLIWFGLLAAIVVFLKRRTEKHSRV